MTDAMIDAMTGRCAFALYPDGLFFLSWGSQPQWFDHGCIKEQRQSTIKSHLVTGCYKRLFVGIIVGIIAGIGSQGNGTGSKKRARHKAGPPVTLIR